MNIPQRPQTLALAPESRPLPVTGRSQALTFPELFGLPIVVDLATAARAVGIHVNTAYKLVKRGEFPCTVLRPGYRYRVPTTGLMKALEIEQVPVYVDDADQGAAFAARFS
jgi:excisionase family DNA binding protein